ncbi:MAG: prolyl oligopeptidase family serine peptidase [Chitinophagaceae bacterium]|nr:prolyl oligopeptidase family serine peptidase [Chitinophagaceae bacterium]
MLYNNHQHQKNRIVELLVAITLIVNATKKMKDIHKSTITMFLCTVSFFHLHAQQTAEKFIQETRYLLYLPEGYLNDTITKWPMIIFMHGSGESGDDIEKVKAHGPPKLIAQGKKFPFIIVSPQASNASSGFQAEVIKGMLTDLKKKYRVDEDRVYLTGLSMGGYGTWEVAEKHPEEFAAIAPICGGGDADRVWRLRHIPVWCFHGAKDDVVPLAASKVMVDSLKKYSKNVRFTVYPDANHNSWEATYNNDSLYTWFLSQKRFKNSRFSLQQNMLKEFTGMYVARGMDTIRIETENDKLMVSIGNYKTEIVPGSDTSFFVAQDPFTEAIIFKNTKGKVAGFWVYDWTSRNLYNKVADDKTKIKKEP